MSHADTITFDDLIKNKAIISSLEKDCPWKDVKFKELFVIAPSLSPSKISDIIQKERGAKVMFGSSSNSG